MRIPSLRDAAGAAALLPLAARLVREHGRPPAILYFGESPGDDLLATAVLRQWRAVRGSRPWYMTKHRALFDGNPDVALLLDYVPHLAGALALLGVRRHRLAYHAYDRADDRSCAPDHVHIINLMCGAAGLPPIPDPVPILTLGDRPERTNGIAVQSSTRSAAMPIANKEWFVDRMQAAVDELGGGRTIVQLGAATDPPLRNVRDLRGRTTIREAAAVLAGSRLFIGMVGFLMHLARAVGTPSVIVYGGREHPSQSGYRVNTNLFTELPCSPCWYWNRCAYDRECMRRITAADVIAAARSALGDRSAQL
jgi:Glycosyltransferase family 9 (heptosyltransferase)